MKNFLTLCFVVLLAVTTSQATAQVAKPLEIGVIPNISARVLLTNYQPLREYLKREYKQPVQISTAPSWQSFFQRTATKDYDIIVTTANLARQAQLDHGYVPLAAFSPDNKGLIIYDKRRPIKSIQDIRGETLALSNPLSLVALRGMHWLREQNLRRGVDFKTLDTPTDDSVGNLLARGDSIAGMCSFGEYKAIPADVREKIEVLMVFAEVPSFIVMANPGLAAADAAEFKKTLLAFSGGSEEGKTFKERTGFVIGEYSNAVLKSMDIYLDETRKMFGAK